MPQENIALSTKKNIALVLSGGGIKAAAFHIGVCLALKEFGFRFAGGTKEQVAKNFPTDDPMVIRLYVGSSAGSFVASVIAAGYSLESLVNAFELGTGVPHPSFTDHHTTYMKPFSYSNVFSFNTKNILMALPRTLLSNPLALPGGLEGLLKNLFRINGFFTTKGAERYLRESVLYHNDFHKLGVKLFILGTELNHSRKVIFGPETSSTENADPMYLSHVPISQAVAASTSLPPFFAPYKILGADQQENYYYDGEIRDTLSSHVAADQGADLVISSYSTQPYHYAKALGSLHRYGIPVILNQALYQLIQQKIEKSIDHQRRVKTCYQLIDQYCLDKNITDLQREGLLKIIQDVFQMRPEVDYLYIHPKPQNHEMFFVDHFSLDPKILGHIVRMGFKAGMSKARRHFND